VRERERERERERAIALDASKHIAIFVLAKSDYIFVLEFLREEREMYHRTI